MMRMLWTGEAAAPRLLRTREQQLALDIASCYHAWCGLHIVVKDRIWASTVGGKPILSRA